MPSDGIFYLILLMILCGTFSIVGNINQLVSYYCKKKFFPNNDNIFNKNTKILINLLHIIYLLLTLAIPYLVLERIQESWILGNETCIFNRILIMLERSTKLWLIMFITLFQYKEYTQLKRQLQNSTTKNDYFSKFSLKISLFIMIIVSGSLILIMLPNCGAFKIILQTFYIDTIKIDIKQIKCGISVSDLYFSIVYGYSFMVEFFIPGIICLTIIIKWIICIKKDPNQNNISLKYLSFIKSVFIFLFLSFYIFLPHWCVLLLKIYGYDVFGDDIAEYLIWLFDELSNINISLSPSISWLPLMYLSNHLSEDENNELSNKKFYTSNKYITNYKRSSTQNVIQQRKYRSTNKIEK
ncbi:GPCR, rhodopsin-like, 7TM domain-containing protein [Strongyloides ratti]|uniref:GPCR, rhodopsin-like, 7TM domain-containing protein n=1 Tax=Strongyloides ratti TaxID=34506 RepID=A0A090KVD3_STRRB|nr:GPCR, rhodopsin-like, 7TM domain-containing protein [Strongyloides ratti]CEF59820.1 GPCR, rhodopsin-like, 7TM domain-containing protein [Strongyloides ratti]